MILTSTSALRTIMSGKSIEWSAPSCRVSLLLGEPGEEVEAIFSSLAGEPAGSSSADRKLGQTSASGPWSIGTLQISKSPGRLDFFYSPAPSNVPGMALLDEPAVDRFRELAVAVGVLVTAKGYSFSRAAIGGQCLCSVQSIEEAYEVFSSYVKSVKIDYPRMREVSFRANIQKRFACAPDILANRMSTWNVITLRMGMFDQLGRQTPLRESHYCVSEFDFSSDAERTPPLPKELVPKILNELVDEIEATLSEGIE